MPISAIRLLSEDAGACGVVMTSRGSFYDPRTRTIELAPSIPGKPSPSTSAVAIHELGHAIQHRETPWLVHLHPALRAFALAAMATGAIAITFGVGAPPIAVAGLLGCEMSLLGGLALVLLERDASRRGLERAVVIPADTPGSPIVDLAQIQSVLDAAALTYLRAPLDGLALLAGIFSAG